MKKTIEGKVYNTATAKRLGTWRNGWDEGYTNRAEEDLCITPKGKYFLHGRGSVMSAYSGSGRQNTRTSEQNIIPLTPAQAQSWAAGKIRMDIAEAIFGPIEEA